MLVTRRNLKFLTNVCCRSYQVAITGAGSEIGQTVALLLRTNPSISKLILHDTLEHTPGIVLDLSHIPSKSRVKGYVGANTLDKALEGSHLVIAAGGVPQHSDGISKSILTKNANYIKTVASAVSLVTPLPFFGILTEPINTSVPLAAEVMRNRGCHDPSKVFGVTAVDALRAQTLYAREGGLTHGESFVPVIGGHSKETAVPLFSQASPKRLTEDECRELTVILREHIMSKRIPRAPVLSVAYGAFLFAQCVLDALNGQVVQINAFVENNDFGTSYFAGLVDVGPKGASKMRTYNDLYRYECLLLERSIKQLRKDVEVGKKMLELV